MNLLESLEIYIPAEAEVKSIPLWSLPNSVLRGMGLPLSDTNGSRKLAKSPEGIWICPAVVRKKGQKTASHAGNSVMENLSSLMSKEFRAAPGPFRMSFVSSNLAAFTVLKETMPGKKFSAHTPHISASPPSSATRTYQYAVVIYHGRIYLSIRKPSRSQYQRETRERPPASQSPIPSTSGMSSKRRKRQLHQTSLEPADKKLQRKKVHSSLAEISPKQPDDHLTRTDSHSTTDGELLNINSKEKHTTCKVTHSENRKDVSHKVRDESSSKTTRSVPQSSGSVHSNCHKNARGEQAAEEAAGLEPSWFQPRRQQEGMTSNDNETQDVGGEEAESTNQSNDMYSNKTIDSSEPENTVSIFEHGRNQSWTRTESQGAACASTSLQQEVDFKDLAQEDKIAQMKAKLRQREAALNSLHS